MRWRDDPTEWTSVSEDWVRDRLAEEYTKPKVAMATVDETGWIMGHRDQYRLVAEDPAANPYQDPISPAFALATAPPSPEPFTVEVDYLPTEDVPPISAVAIIEPLGVPYQTDAAAPLVDEPLAAPRLEAAEQQRAAQLEQEIALCQSQAEVARQQHPNPTAAATEVRADIATAEAKLEALSDAVGLPDPDTLPHNVVRLALQSDGSVSPVVVESEPDRVSDSPTPAREPEPIPEPTRQREPVESEQPKEPVEPTRKPVADSTPGVEAKDAELVDTGRAWQDLTHEEKARAVAEYNRALSALRTLAEVAREIEETNNVGWAWEAKCSQLQQELTELLRPTPPITAPGAPD